MSARPFIIDTDGGVDDALAIMIAVRSPEVDLQAITTVAGNVAVDQATQNVFTVLDVLGASPCEVASGAHVPILRDLPAPGDIHGSDGLGELARFVDDGKPRYPLPTPTPSDRNAVEVLLSGARKFGPDLTIVSIGPLTNIALAVRADPVAMASVGRMVTMGGAATIPGNMSPVAEYNMWADPEGASIAFEGMSSTTLVGLDVTNSTPLTRGHVNAMATEHPSKITRFARDITDFYMNFYHTHEGFDGCYLHDPLALSVAIDPSLVVTESLEVWVETRGEYTSGMVVADRRARRNANPEKTIDVALEVDTERMLRDYLSRLI